MDKLKTVSLNPQCQIVVFNWNTVEDIEGLSRSELAKSIPQDVSPFLREVSFNKTLSSPSGQFSFTLPNDRDWKEYIKIGSWCLIYMTNDGKLELPSNNAPTVSLGNGNLQGITVNLSKLKSKRQYLRCIGYIETVRARGTVGQEIGEFDVDYVVSGRDFGSIYENTEIWHNRTQFEETLLLSADAFIRSPNGYHTVDNLLKLLHDLMLAPEKISKDLGKQSLTSIGTQWLLPTEMLTSLGINISGDTFFGKIPDLLNFESTNATFPVESPLALLNGVVWQRLRAHSIEPFHELYPELDDTGYPKLNFRPIPWRISDGAKFPSLATNVKKFGDSDYFNLVLLSDLDILSFDLGEDDHNRFNLFWPIVKTSSVTVEDNPAPIKDEKSINRYGLRIMSSEVNANVTLGTEKLQYELIQEYIELFKEYWDKAFNFESGTLEIIGNNEIKVGKIIDFDENVPYNGNKLFYIEGYSDNFIVDENGSASWTQSITVTRGIDRKKLNENKNYSKRSTTYKQRGDFT